MSTLPKLLIIDDLSDNIDLLADYLSEIADVHYALSGPEALALIAINLPDLILLDVMMPDMDGYEVCAALKRDPRTRQVPVIFVTARNDTESESKALAAGAVDFIHKPVNKDVVRARVQLQLDLKARERELRELNAELEQRVAERTQALRDSLIRAEAGHRAKNLFLANVSHELRTPLSAILGFSGLLSKQLSEQAKLCERIDKISAAGQHLLGIINDIIDIAKLQADDVQTDTVDFALSSVIDAAWAPYHGHADAKGLVLERKDDPALPKTLRGDAQRLGQILRNLLGNAVKFSEHGRIILRSHLAEDLGEGILLQIEIEDQGIGIDADRQAAIFNIFEQADNSSTRRYGGTGLGLAICKQLVELMGGKIGVSSVSGQGSLFWFTVPLGRGIIPFSKPPIAQEALGLEWEETLEVDWNRLREVIVPLDGLLLTGEDIEAYILWSKAGHVLNIALGEQMAKFNKAMEDFDFKTALIELQAVRAAFAELGRSDGSRRKAG